MTRKDVKVLFIWNVREELREYLSKGLAEYSNVQLIFPEDATEEVFLTHAPEVDIIVGWRPKKELLEAATNLRLFINPGAGVQHLTELFQEVTKDRNITLVNGHGNTYFTAQHAVALLLALTNKIIPHHQWMVEKQWRKRDEDAQSIPIRDRQIGLLGYGAINTKVHRFLAGFDVQFHIAKRDWSRKRIDEYPTEITKYSMDQFEEFLQAIDILFVAVPLTTETEGLIGSTELALLGSKGLLVTVARGPIINEESLYQALKNGTIAGAAIDVWYNYRPEPDENGGKFPSKYPFYKLDNVVLSPHRGASPMSDLRRWNEVIENISRFAQEEYDFLNVVNVKDGY
jgi:phosphoglycerate dehydrogenase-like enzyme